MGQKSYLEVAVRLTVTIGENLKQFKNMPATSRLFTPPYSSTQNTLLRVKKKKLGFYFSYIRKHTLALVACSRSRFGVKEATPLPPPTPVIGRLTGEGGRRDSSSGFSKRICILILGATRNPRI